MENDAISIEMKRREMRRLGVGVQTSVRRSSKSTLENRCPKIIDVNIRKEQACSQDNKKKTRFISEVNYRS